MERTKSHFLKELGKRIAYLREQKGLNQSQLAAECEKDRQSINRLEKGNVNPSAFYLYQVAKALNVSVSELFNFND